MIFSADMLALVLAGEKSQTRRIIRRRETDCRYQHGRIYSVQPGRGQAAVARITITQPPRHEPLGKITPKDAKREGFRNALEFRNYWTELHGTWTPDQDVWVITFALGELTDTPRLLRGSAPTAPICRAKVKTRDGRSIVCNRAFQDEQTICKCGARRPPESEQDEGYTSRKATAMRGEAEAVPRATQERITRQAADNETNGYIVQRERLRDAVSEIRKYAKDSRAIDTLKGIERQLAALDRKMQAAA